MTINLKIDNPYTQKQLEAFIKEQKEVTLEVLSQFIDSFSKKEKFDFKKKDPKKYSRIIEREYDSEDVDDVALLHIKDSAKYVHNLRREKR